MSTCACFYRALETDYTFVSGGRTVSGHGSHRAYTYRETVSLLEAVGFDVETSEPWSRQARSVRFIATKPMV